MNQKLVLPESLNVLGIDILGDRVLLNESEKFCKFRRSLLDSGISFSSDPDLLFRYRSDLLNGLDLLTGVGAVAYEANFGKDLFIDELQSGALGVYTVHESIHLFLRNRISIPTDTVSIICEEALAGCFEWLLALEMESSLSQVAWKLQSPVQVASQNRRVAELLVAKTSEVRLFEFMLRSFLSSLFLRDNDQVYDFEETCASIGIYPDEDFFTLFKVGFDMDDQFRRDTVWGYIKKKLKLESLDPAVLWSNRLPSHALNGFRCLTPF